jgi:hypothetical protein
MLHLASRLFRVALSQVYARKAPPIKKATTTRRSTPLELTHLDANALLVVICILHYKLDNIPEQQRH